MAIALEPGAWKSEPRRRACHRAGSAANSRRAKLDAGKVPQSGDLAILASLDNDRAKFFWRLQASLGVHVQLEIDAGQGRGGADDASGRLDVLLTDRVGDIARGKATLGHFCGSSQMRME